MFGLLLSSTATLAIAVIYFLHDTHFILAVILRIIAGFGHGPLFPATYTFWSMWATPLERSTLTSIGFCSTGLGTCKSTFFLFIELLLIIPFLLFKL
jgi:MFS family permease